MSGRGSSRWVAGVSESPVWGLGGRCVRPRGFGFRRGLEDEFGGEGGVGG